MTELTVVNAFAAQIAFTAQMLLPSLTSKNGVWQHGCTEVNSGTSQLPSPANSLCGVCMFSSAWLFSSHRNIHIRLIEWD